jgi:polar amino acid transport system substrate-binding protein
MSVRKIVLIICFAAGAALSTSVNAQQPTVRVGVSYSSPSWSWYDVSQSDHKGLFVDLMREIGEDAGFQVTFAGAALNHLATLLTSNQIDAIATIFVETPERIAVADFSNPVYVYGEALLVRRDDTRAFASVADLAGLTVAPGVYAPQLTASGVPMTLTTDVTTVSGIQGLLNGNVDAVVFSEPTVAYFDGSGDYPDIMMSRTYVPQFTRPVGIAVRKGDTELMGKINTSLEALMSNGTVETIFENYGIDWARPN